MSFSISDCESGRNVLSVASTMGPLAVNIENYIIVLNLKVVCRALLSSKSNDSFPKLHDEKRPKPHTKVQRLSMKAVEASQLSLASRSTSAFLCDSCAALSIPSVF